MSDEQPTPQLSDADLLAYLDGELEEELARGIEGSAAYQRRLNELARREQHLVALLHRAGCPDAHELGEYHLKLLHAARAELVAQHVAGCTHCARELQELGTFMEELAPDLEYNLVERVRVLIARLTPNIPNFGAGPRPALAGVRGDAGGPLLYEVGDVQVSLEVQDDAAGAGRKSILGLLTGADPTGWQATLWHEDGPLSQLIETVEVDDLGNFVVEGVLPGSYALTLRGDDLEVVIQDLSVP